MMARRVVITGIGAITPLGASLGETVDALSGVTAPLGPATLFDASAFACNKAAEIRDWDPRPSFRLPKALKLTDRPARFAVAAATMALADTKWPPQPSSNERLGVAIGTSGSDLQARDIARALANDPSGRRVSDIPTFADRMMAGLNPLWLLTSLPNMISAHVAIQLEARGANTTVMSDWAAGHQAIGEASEWIRGGEAEAVLAGGADSGVQPFAFVAFEKAGWLTAENEFVPGEGAAVFLLEEREAALRRGATVYAEIIAYATRGAHGRRTAAATLAQTLCDALGAAGWNRGTVNICSIAGPPIPEFCDATRDALRMSLEGVIARETSDPRLGYPLAAAAPIDAAIHLHTLSRGTRMLSSAVGSSHEAVTLALEVGPR